MLDLFGQGLEFELQGDYENALRFYKQAAEQGDINAQLNIGHIYRSGRSGEKKTQLAAKYYLQAAEQGAVGAQRRLGDMYELVTVSPKTFRLHLNGIEKLQSKVMREHSGDSPSCTKTEKVSILILIPLYTGI